MFITFEGIDGCGKTTQIKLLRQYLEKKGIEVLTLRDPGGTDFSEKIRDLLLNAKHKVASRTELMLFEAARAHLVESVIKPALNNGKIVICDRFYDSTTAYQAFGRGLPLEYVNFCNMFATGGLNPDITFYLKITLEESKRRSHHKYFDRIEQSGDTFFRKVIEGYEFIAKSEPERFIIIDASGRREETSSIIIATFEEIFNKRMSK